MGVNRGWRTGVSGTLCALRALRAPVVKKDGVTEPALRGDSRDCECIQGEAVIGCASTDREKKGDPARTDREKEGADAFTGQREVLKTTLI